MITMFDNLCRLCSEPHHNEALEIFSTESDKTVAIMIQECTRLVLEENDNLPAKICQDCHSKLRTYYAFQKQCESIDYQFRQELILSTNAKYNNHFYNKNNINISNESAFCNDRSKEVNFTRDSFIPKGNLSTKNKHMNFKKVKLKENTKQLRESRADKNETKINMCYLCGALVKRIHSHMKAHRDAEKPKHKKFRCEKCGAAFSRLNNLNIHLKTHLDVKPLQCTLCDKRFIIKRYLDRHMNVHTGNRPWQCQFCTKAFQTKYNLNTHVRVHTREKPFNCPYCEQCFRQRAALNLHVRTHDETVNE